MTPTPAPQNNIATAITSVTGQVLTYTPLALATVAGIERAASGLPGQTKAQIAINVILTAAHAGEGIPVPSVAAIAGLVDLVVSLLNASGLFAHKSKVLIGSLGNAGLNSQILEGLASVNLAQNVNLAQTPGA